MKVRDYPRFKSVLVPASFSDLIGDICGDDYNLNFLSRFWRGRAQIDWRIDSTAYRRAQDSGTLYKKNPHKSAIGNDQRLLARAKHLGFDIDGGRRLSDWQLIAKLRHFGAATSLLDVSKNPLVALWFASSSDQKKTGLLVGVHCHHVGGSEGDNTTWGDYLEELKDTFTFSHPMLFDPSIVSPRVSAQSSVFLFGKESGSRMGAIVYEEILHAYKFYAITPKLKIEAMTILDQVFGINRMSLFPDIEGFSQANSPLYDISANDRW